MQLPQFDLTMTINTLFTAFVALIVSLVTNWFISRKVLKSNRISNLDELILVFRTLAEKAEIAVQNMAKLDNFDRFLMGSEPYNELRTYALKLCELYEERHTLQPLDEVDSKQWERWKAISKPVNLSDHIISEEVIKPRR